MNSKSKAKVSLNSLVYTADAANSKDTQKKAVELYKQGKLFNIVLRGVGTIGDFEISKNRIYTNDAVAEAFTTYNSLINEFPYYRFMFDSHPSSESDEKPDMGESNSYDNIASYILKLNLENKNINGHNHNVITFDYVITKQSVIDYFMRSVDPIISISHRGFMGQTQKVPRDMVKRNFENVTFLDEAFKNLDFWDSNSDTIDVVEFLRLLGFDLVTYPADFFCISRKQDVVGYNVTDYDTVKDTNNVSTNYVFQYMKDKCANIHSPYSVLRMQVDKSYMLNSLKSTAALDEVKFILQQNNGEVNKMKIELEKLTDQQYVFGVFEDLNGMFKDVSELWSLNSDNIGEWLDSALKDEFKTKIENMDEFTASIKTLMDNHDKFKNAFADWNATKIMEHNTQIMQVMVDAIGTEKFATIMDKKFNVTDDDVASILAGYKETNTELYESLNSNLITMASDFDYYKQIADGIMAGTQPTTDNDPAPADPEDKNTSTVDNANPVEDPAATDPAIDNDPAPTEDPVVEDGLKFNTDPSTAAWNGGDTKKACGSVLKDEVLSEDDQKKMIDEVFAIQRCYDKQACWKLPHHDVAVNGSAVSVTLNEQGVKSAVAALMGARTSVIATSAEKKEAAAHLKKHYDEMGLEVPDALSKLADNEKFADLVTDGDLVLSLDDAFVTKIIDEMSKIETEIDVESEVIKVLDSIYTIMRPFVKDGAVVSIDEELYKKLAQSINGAAIGIAAVMNGEGSDLMNLEDNAIMSNMRNQINNLKDEVVALKDSQLSLTKERDGLVTKVSDYETKISTIGQLSEDMDKATKLVEEINSLNNAKLSFLYQNRGVVDEDIFKEIVGAKSTDQLQVIGKWTSKMGNKKVTVSNMFADKIIPEPVATNPVDDNATTTPVALKTVTDTQPILDSDQHLKTILSLIKSN